MTRITLLASTILFAFGTGQALAQATPVVLPNPVNASPTLPPALDLSAETGLNPQGAGDTSYIEQIGTSNWAEVDQSASHQGTAAIEQNTTGIGHDAVIVQSDDVPETGGDGEVNRARIYQFGGDWSNAQITQNYDGPGADNIALIEQTTWFGLGNDFNVAEIDQNGRGNEARIRQRGVDFGQSRIEQDGTSNEADNLQTAAADFSYSNIDQTGAFNRAFVGQHGFSSWSVVYQVGNSNQAYVVQ